MGSNGGYIGYDATPTGDGKAPGIWGMRDVYLARRRETWPHIVEDTFDTDSTAQYTQSSDGAATWAISGGELVATGGTQSVFIRNGTSYADVVIECDINHAYDGGLVLRFVNNSNYYLLVLADDSSANPSQNLRIFSRVAGSFTLLGEADVTWARGTSKKIRFRAVGTALSASVEGTQVLSVVDSAIAGPGGVGVRNNSAGQQAKYQALRWGLWV